MIPIDPKTLAADIDRAGAADLLDLLDRIADLDDDEVEVVTPFDRVADRIIRRFRTIGHPEAGNALQARLNALFQRYETAPDYGADITWSQDFAPALKAFTRC